MNIFVLHENPILAATMIDDNRLPKMVTESAQMLASALIRHGATPESMPLTKAGTPYKGGYHNHPCTVWAGDSLGNFAWLMSHGLSLAHQYKRLFGRDHACDSAMRMMLENPAIENMGSDELTPFARAFDRENKDLDELYDEEKYTAVEAYRIYYKTKADSPAGIKYERVEMPEWFNDSKYIYGVNYEVSA